MGHDDPVCDIAEEMASSRDLDAEPPPVATSWSSVLTPRSPSEVQHFKFHGQHRSKPHQMYTRCTKILPSRYEECDVEDMVVLISTVIEEAVSHNDDDDDGDDREGGGGVDGYIPIPPYKIKIFTRFHSRSKPAISIEAYISRLATCTKLAPALLLTVVYYIDRFTSVYPDFLINSFTAHRFLIAAAVVAVKGLSDVCLDMAVYAQAGGVSTAELKLLVEEFLHRMDWKIVPSPEVLVTYYQGLVARSSDYVFE